MKKNWKIIIPAIAIIASLTTLGVYERQKQKKFEDPLDKMTLSQAAQQGELTEMKLLIQIKTPVGDPNDANSRLERGDVVLAKPADWQFSDTEKEIFLIIKVKMTPTLANLIVKPLEKNLEARLLGDIKEGEPQPKEQLKRRKFAVDLGKIGIKDSDEQGREITDKTFDWEILRQK